MKKKVLFIMRDFQGGGAERVTIDYLTYLNKEKFEPIVFIMKKSGAFLNQIPKDVRVVFATSEAKFRLTSIPRLLYLLIKEAKKVDIIIGTLELTTTYFAAILGKLFNKNSIGWTHINLKYFPPANTKVHKQLTKLLYPFLNTIICVSDGIVADIRSRFPGIKSKIITLYNPISLNDILKKGDESFEKEDVPIVVGAGRLSTQKNFKLLISAHKKVIDQGIRHKLIILGEGAERANLQEFIKENEMENSAFLYGFKNNPYKYIKNAKVFALSSDYEGFAIVVAEALALGTPVVSTNCPSGPSEILENGKYGKLVPTNDVDSYAKELIEILTNTHLSRELSERGLLRAKDFTPEVIVPKFEELLSKK